jgi:hypothetical protein
VYPAIESNFNIKLSLAVDDITQGDFIATLQISCYSRFCGLTFWGETLKTDFKRGVASRDRSLIESQLDNANDKLRLLLTQTDASSSMPTVKSLAIGLLLNRTTFFVITLP